MGLKNKPVSVLKTYHDILINVKDYVDAKFGCVPLAFHFLCHYKPRELPGGKFLVAQPRHPGFFGLRNV